MSDAPSLPAMPSRSPELVTAETDYKQLTDALMQTQRGRRFLAEHARRCRQTQQADLLAALARLERAIAVDRELPEMAKLRSDLAALARAVESVRTDVAALRPAARPDRRRPQDEEMLRLLREQSTRLDALADIWREAHGPASPAPASALRPAIEASDSRDQPGNGKEPHEKTALRAQNGAADGPAGEPYGAETPASDLLRQTPIFDLAFDSMAAAEPTAGLLAASEQAVEAAGHSRSGEFEEPAPPFAIVRDSSGQAGEATGEPSEHHPDTKADLPASAAPFAILRDAVEQDGDENGEPLAHQPDKSDSLPEPEQQLQAPEVPAAETPAASIAPEAPSASLMAESPPPAPVADEPPFAPVAACAAPTIVAAAGDPLAPLHALSEEERIALFT